MERHPVPYVDALVSPRNPGSSQWRSDFDSPTKVRVSQNWRATHQPKLSLRDEDLKRNICVRI